MMIHTTSIGISRSQWAMTETFNYNFQCKIIQSNQFILQFVKSVMEVSSWKQSVHLQPSDEEDKEIPGADCLVFAASNGIQNY